MNLRFKSFDLLQIIFYATLIWIVAYYIVGFLSVTVVFPLEFVYETELETDYGAVVRRFGGGLIASLIILYAYLNLKVVINNGLSNLFMVISMLVFINLLVSGYLNLNFAFGLLSSWFFFELMSKQLRSPQRRDADINMLFHTSAGRLFQKIMVAFILLPLFLQFFIFSYFNSFYIPISGISQLYNYDGFRGFSVDRAHYAFLAGLFFILAVFSYKGGWKALLVMFLLLAAIIMSGTKSVMIMVAITLIFYFKNHKRLFPVAIVLLFITLVFIAILGNRGGLFDATRFDLIMNSLQVIFFTDLNTLLFGQGRFNVFVCSDVFGTPQQPHNSLLQTALNFGLVVTVLWVIYLYGFFIKLNKHSQAVFVYGFGFGLFQVGFSLFNFIPTNFLLFIIILILSIAPRRIN